MNFIGLRRLHLLELGRLNEGEAFILVIPLLQNVRKDIMRNVIVKQRHTNVHDPIVVTVLKNHGSTFWDTHNTLLSKRFKKHLLKYHGISWTNMMYIELPCVAHSYPHRFDYNGGSLAATEVRCHVKEWGGDSS